MARLKIKGKYQHIKEEFEKLTGVTEKLQASLEAEQASSKAYIKELEPLRRNFTIVEKQNTLLEQKLAQSLESSKYHSNEKLIGNELLLKYK